MANKWNTVMYIGITSNLEGRVYQHKIKEMKGFTSRYNVNKLVYYEEYGDVYEAIAREKQLKNWKRQWKVGLIQRENPEYIDLAYDWFKLGDSGSSPE